MGVFHELLVSTMSLVRWYDVATEEKGREPPHLSTHGNISNAIF